MEQWKHLKVGDGKLPPLLIKAMFNTHGYSIRLTDLSRIWVETLSKDEIVTRARKRNCSIDPGEDGSQHKIYVDKMQSALNQDFQTNLAVSATNDGKLKLHLEAPLPSSLPTFEWEVSLERANYCDMGVELVSPLIYRAHNLNHRMELLIAEIHAKDKIIAKITDRLETSGHDLTAVFPGVSNVKLTRNISQQEQLARHIRGLGKFDEEAWKAQLNTVTDKAILSEDLEDAIFASLPRPVGKSDNTDKVVDWWQQIPVGRHIDLDPEGSGNLPSKASNQDRSLLRGDTSDADASQHDDFQKQATPPRLRRHSSPKAPQVDVEMSGTGGPALLDEDSTEDEDDLDQPLQKRAVSPKRVPQEAIAPQAPPESPSPSPTPVSKPPVQASTTRGPFTHEEETDDDDDDDLDGPSQPSQNRTSTSQLASRQKSQTAQPAIPTTTKTKSPPRKALGKLGGPLLTKSKSRSPTPPIEEEPLDATPATNPPQSEHPIKVKPKLGTIGGIKAKTNPQPSHTFPPPQFTTQNAAAVTTARNPTTMPEPQAKPKSSRQPTVERTVEPKPVEQTEAERADAKREALKRELEEKAKAPVKKKRRF